MYADKRQGQNFDTNDRDISSKNSLIRRRNMLCKRRNNLIKKAMLISMTCEQEIFMVVFDK